MRKRSLDRKIFVSVKGQKLPGVIAALLQKQRGLGAGNIVRGIQKRPLPGGENKFLTGVSRGKPDGRGDQTFRVHGNHQITERPQGKIVDFANASAEQKIFPPVGTGPGDRSVSL